MEPTTDFNDWELLQHNSDSHSVPLDSLPDEIDSRGLIRANYFSLGTLNRRGEDFDDNKSVPSDNPSWIDPGLEENPTRYLNGEPAELWSNSSSERSDDRRRNHLEGTENEKERVSSEIIGETVEQKVEKVEDLVNCYSDSSGIESAFDKLSDCVENSGGGSETNVVLRNDLSVLGRDKHENEVNEKGGETTDGNETKNGGEIEKRPVVWWKMPVEFLKYCVFKMSPVWTVSVAAAVMGFLILGRRLYKMKKKTRGLEIKVTVDDKKASQVMSRAARLNEAFSIVKRVPVIRPSLPTVGVTTWPVMITLR